MSRRDEWFRNDSWDDAEQHAFFQRLNRSKGAFHRIQYLNAKTTFLENSGDADKVNAAIELQLQVCREAEAAAQDDTRDDGKLYRQWALNAIVKIGCIRLGQGRSDEAIARFREALRQQSGSPPDPYITKLARALYEANRVSEFAEILDLLDASFQRHKTVIAVFHGVLFEYAFFQAALSFRIGRIDAAKAYAESARNILGAADHGIGRRMNAGKTLATDEERAEIDRILTFSDAGGEKDILDFLNSLPPGTRSKEDIDQQIREERESWGDR